MTPSPAPRRARRPSDIPQHFRDGLEAALRADPELVATTKTRTLLGAVVKGLALEASRGKPEAIRVMMSLLGQTEPEANETRERTEPRCQGLSGDLRRWDWSREGDWEAAVRDERRQKEEADASDADPGFDAEKVRESLRRRFLQVAEADREEQQRKALLGSTSHLIAGAPKEPP